MVSPTGSELTPAGEELLRELKVDVDALRRARRTYVLFCVDWSERRDHLAGAVGAAIIDAFFEHGWIARMPETRAVRSTLRGREGLYRLLGIPMEKTAGGARPEAGIWLE